MIVLFLLLKPLTGTPTQFSLRVQLHSFYEAQLEIFFFQKIPATSWILSCLFLLTTPDGCVACTSQASPTQSRYFIKKISFTSENEKNIWEVVRLTRKKIQRTNLSTWPCPKYIFNHSTYFSLSACHVRSCAKFQRYKTDMSPYFQGL